MPDQVKQLDQVLDTWRKRSAGNKAIAHQLDKLKIPHKFERIGGELHLLLYIGDGNKSVRAVLRQPNRFKVRLSRIKRFVPSRFAFMRTVEFVGVTVALFAFGWEFLVERPRDRAFLKANVYAQLAPFEQREGRAFSSSIANTLEAFALEGIAISGIATDQLYVTGYDLSDLSLQMVSFKNSWFYDSDLSDVRITGGDYSDSVFFNTKMNSIEVVGYPEKIITIGPMAGIRTMRPKEFRVDFSRVIFAGSDLSSARFFEANLEHSRFRMADLTNSHFENVIMSNVSFDMTVIDGAVFKNVDFTGADLSGAWYDRVQFIDCIFTDAKLPKEFDGNGIISPKNHSK